MDTKVETTFIMRDSQEKDLEDTTYRYKEGTSSWSRYCTNECNPFLATDKLEIMVYSDGIWQKR